MITENLWAGLYKGLVGIVKGKGGEIISKLSHVPR